MWVPRLHISATYNMKKVLSRLGISKIFEEHGDLTRISSHRSLKVGEVSLPGWTTIPSYAGVCLRPQSELLSELCNPRQTTSQSMIQPLKLQLSLTWFIPDMSCILTKCWDIHQTHRHPGSDQNLLSKVSQPSRKEGMNCTIETGRQRLSVLQQCSELLIRERKEEHVDSIFRLSGHNIRLSVKFAFQRHSA